MQHWEEEERILYRAVKDVIKEIRAPAGFTIDIYPLSTGVGTILNLVVKTRVLDSRWVPGSFEHEFDRPGIPVESGITIPPTLSYYGGDLSTEIVRLVRRCFHNFATHEMDEWLQYKGKLIHDPHAPSEEWLV